MKKRNDIFLCVVCFIMASIFGVLTFALPRESFSESENRALAQLPRLTFSGVADGSFFSGLRLFFEDQFPMRRNFTTIRAISELTLGRKENNRVIYGKDGYLVLRPQYKSLELFEENIEAISKFSLSMRCQGIETAVFFAPRGVDVLDNYLPQGYPDERDDYLWERAAKALPALLEANDAIRASAGRGEYVWYKTDHHWTPLGAYEGYLTIAGALGGEIEPLSLFHLEELSDNFYGSVDSRSGSVLNSPDSFFVLRHSDDGSRLVVNYDLGRIETSLYCESAVTGKDKYKVFLGGNYGHLGIYSDNSSGEREKLLVIKDSFANSLLPFLAIDYDLEVYDLRYFDGMLSDEIAAVDPDKILILYGIDTAVTDGSLKRLGR